MCLFWSVNSTFQKYFMSILKSNIIYYYKIYTWYKYISDNKKPDQNYILNFMTKNNKNIF